MRPALTLPFLTLLCLAQPALIKIQHPHLMMVVSKGLPGITIYDADTERPVCRAIMGKSPHEAAFSNTGQFAFVPVYGDTGVGRPGTDEHMLQFIRSSDCKNVFSLDTGENKRPHGISVGQSGAIYLTAEVSKSLLVIDPDRHRIVAKIGTDSPFSHMIAVTRDEKKIYVSNVQSKTVSVIDIPNRKLTQVISTPAENQRMALSPDEQWFATSFGPEHKIAFYRTTDNRLDFTVLVEGAPFVAKFSEDGKYLYDAGIQNGDLRAWKIDIAQRRVAAASAKLGTAVGSLAVSPFNHEIYVSDSAGSQISEIDPESWQVVKVLRAAQTPDAILFKSVQ